MPRNRASCKLSNPRTNKKGLPIEVQQGIVAAIEHNPRYSFSFLAERNTKLFGKPAGSALRQQAKNRYGFLLREKEGKRNSYNSLLSSLVVRGYAPSNYNFVDRTAEDNEDDEEGYDFEESNIDDDDDEEQGNYDYDIFVPLATAPSKKVRSARDSLLFSQQRSNTCSSCARTCVPTQVK